MPPSPSASSPLPLLTGMPGSPAEAPLVLVLEVGASTLSATLFEVNGLHVVYVEVVEWKKAHTKTMHADTPNLSPSPSCKKGASSWRIEEEDSYCNTALFTSFVRALDSLLERLQASCSPLLGRVKAITSTTVPSFAMFLAPSAPTMLATLSSSDNLESQLLHQGFFRSLDSATSSPKEPVLAPANVERRRRGGDGEISRKHYRHHTGPLVSPFAMQVNRAALSTSWESCAHVITLGNLLDSLLLGRMATCNPVEAASTGLFDALSLQWRPDLAQACSAAQQKRLLMMLPDVINLDETHRIGHWLAARVCLPADCLLVTSIPSFIASYLSFRPGQDEAGMQLGSTDTHIIPLEFYQPSPHLTIYSNPLHLLQGVCRSYSIQRAAQRPWLAVSHAVDAGRARHLVRENYTKTWKAFGQLIQAVCPGGTVGLDNKLFTLFVSSGPSKGLRRYENGTRVSEFNDLRANPRCVIEGQALGIRRVMSQVMAQDRHRSLKVREKTYQGAAGWLGFDPCDLSLIPSRWFAWGQVHGSESIIGIFAQVLGAPVVVDECCTSSSEDCAGESQREHTGANAPLGAALFASLLLEKDSSEPDTVGESIRHQLRPRSALASVEEGEDDLDEGTACHTSTSREGQQATPSGLLQPCPSPNTLFPPISLRRIRSVTTSFHNQRPSISFDTQRERSSSMTSTSLIPSLDGYWSDSNLVSAAVAPHPAILSPVPAQTVLPIRAENEERLGSRRRALRVAEPDRDMWDFYGGMLEEHIRLAGMVEWNSAVG